MSNGRARHGVADMIQEGVFFWLALRRIRISPVYLGSSRDIPRNILTRTTGAEIPTDLIPKLRNELVYGTDGRSL